MTPFPDRPLELLFERDDLPRSGLPAGLSALYGGDLGFETPRLFANLVASVDGVVTLASGGESGHIISQDSAADRFVMGLLRSCADAVVVGAGTFRKAPGHDWVADAIYPAGATLFREARARRGLRPRPTLVLVTGSGVIDVTQPAVADAIIVTTPAGEANLRSRLPSTARLLVRDGNPLRFADVLASLRGEGLSTVLTEGGPSLLAHLLDQHVLDELFVTKSPVLFGRYADDRRKSLVDGLDLGGAPLGLMSARRHGSHLFLRYAVDA